MVRLADILLRLPIPHQCSAAEWRSGYWYWVSVACFISVTGGLSLGCSSSDNIRMELSKLGKERRCWTTIHGQLSPEQHVVIPRSSENDIEDALSQFSPDVVELGRVLDILPLLNEIAALDQTNQESLIEFLDLRQQLTDHILLALFETASTVAELTCERDRSNQSADRMEAKDASRMRSLTVVSLLFGGLAAIASGGLGLAGTASVASNSADVAGGAFSTIFGGAALMNHATEEFRHERNLLAEIWNDPEDSKLFSPAIWRFLHLQHKERSATPRDELLDAWQQEGRLGELGSEEQLDRMALIFGEGGLYAAADLRARSAMLETLAATIRLIHDELEEFFHEITRRFARRRYS